jgi:F420-0:gamma-glutamyl ligase
MSTVSVSTPFPIFTDIDGQPLENGYIFIGIANLGPIGNPINVYWDAALTIPAAQPIRTLGGYPINNGTPARLYVNSDYSIQVQNRNGSVVYSAPVDTEFMSSANVSYTPAGTGAVATTVQAKLRESVSVTL